MPSMQSINQKLMRQMDVGDPISASFGRTLLTMTVSELVSSLAVVIDGVIIVRCLGSGAMSAHGLVGPFLLLQKVLGGFFAVGTQVVCTGEIGRANQQRANHIFTFAFWLLFILSTLIGLLISVFSGVAVGFLGAGNAGTELFDATRDYLLGLAVGLPFNTGTMLLMPIVTLNGHKKHVTAAAYAMMIVNIAGDLLNVYVFKLGMLGMGLATSVSYLWSFLILLNDFRKQKGVRFAMTRFHFRDFMCIAKTGLLPSFARICGMLKSYLINMIYIAYASMVVLAANTLIQSNVKVLLICVATALGQTTMIMTGVLYSEEDRSGLCRMFKTAVRISLLPCSLLAIVIFIFAPSIISIFGADAEMAGYAVRALRFFIVGFPLIGLKMFYIYYFQGSSNTLLSTVSSVLGELVFITMTSFLLVQWMGSDGLWLAYPLSEFLFLVVVFIIICVKNKGLPRKLEDFLMLPETFGVPPEDQLDYRVQDPSEIVGMSEAAKEFCLEHGLDKRTSYFFALAIEEMAYNIFEHGHKDEKTHFVDLRILRKEGTTKLRIRDDSRPFNPEEKLAMLPPDKPEKGIGLRILYGMAGNDEQSNIHYANVLNLNNLIVEVKDSDTNIDMKRITSEATA